MVIQIEKWKNTVSSQQGGSVANKLTDHRDESENADKDGDGEEDKDKGVELVVAFLNYRLGLGN